MVGRDRKFSCRTLKTFGQTFSGNVKMSMSCFLENVDRLQKLKKTSFDGSPSVSGLRLFHLDIATRFEAFERQRNDE